MPVLSFISSNMFSKKSKQNFATKQLCFRTAVSRWWVRNPLASQWLSCILGHISQGQSHEGNSHTSWLSLELSPVHLTPPACFPGIPSSLPSFTVQSGWKCFCLNLQWALVAWLGSEGCPNHSLPGLLRGHVRWRNDLLLPCSTGLAVEPSGLGTAWVSPQQRLAGLVWIPPSHSLAWS